MARITEFVQLVLDLMAPIGGIRARAMFGGFGIYQRDTMFAIIVDDRLYFKADGSTRLKFEQLGLSPFMYVARGKAVTLQYYEAPPDVFEAPDAMRGQVLEAIGVALRASRPKKGKQSA